MSIYNIIAGQEDNSFINKSSLSLYNNILNNANHFKTNKIKPGNSIKYYQYIIKNNNNFYLDIAKQVPHDSKVIRITNNTSAIKNNLFNITNNKFSDLTSSFYNINQNIEPLTFAPNYPIRIKFR